MDTVVMESPEKYRQYAEDCRRLAERAAPKDKAILLEMASTWEGCAVDAEGKLEKLRKSNDDINASC